MTLEVLVSTMHQKDYSLLDRMNIQSDAIVVNQCDTDKTEEFLYKNNKIKWISTTERGIGRSRNRAFIASTADIIIFADEDIVYTDGYAGKIKETFENNNKYSVVLFNFRSLNPDRPEILTPRDHRICWYNCLKYGAFRIAIKTDPLRRANVFFSLLFGGGAQYQAGEDNLFLTDCLKAGLKSMASTVTLGTVEQKASTWFKGYDEKYYYDRGALFAAMYGRIAKCMIALFEVKTRAAGSKKDSLGTKKRIEMQFKGCNSFRYYLRGKHNENNAS